MLLTGVTQVLTPLCLSLSPPPIKFNANKSRFHTNTFLVANPFQGFTKPPHLYPPKHFNFLSLKAAAAAADASGTCTSHSHLVYFHFAFKYSIFAGCLSSWIKYKITQQSLLHTHQGSRVDHIKLWEYRVWQIFELELW